MESELSEWQPIETAPKDGRAVLLFQGAFEAPDPRELELGIVREWRIVVGYFHETPPERLYRSERERDGPPGRWLDQPSGWCVGGVMRHNGGAERFPLPTHWQPLPTPPAA